MGMGMRAALFAAALGLASMPVASPATSALQKGVVMQSARRYDVRRSIFGGGDLGGGSGRRAGYGWTNAHQKRVARKKRNQARHRAAMKRR